MAAAEFFYTGVDRKGSKVSGSLRAVSEAEVRMILRSQGIRPTSLSKGAAAAAFKGGDLGDVFRSLFGNSVSLDLLVPFTRQLQVLLTSGIPLVQGLEMLAEGQTDKNFRNILTEIHKKVSEGSYFWEALQEHGKGFPRLYVSLVRAGEVAGAMENVLGRLAKYLENAHKLRQLLKGAMFYPVAILIVAFGVIALMMIFVIPKFKEMIVSSGGELPWITEKVINMSNFFVDNILIIIATIILSVWAIMKFINSKNGKAMLDRVIFRVPLFGKIAQLGAMARFSRTIQTLLASGVNLIDAVEICKTAVDNVLVEEALAKIKTNIEAGKTLGGVVMKMPIFPRMAAQMIIVGESSGSLDRMLEKVADYYEGEVEQMTAGLTKLIEPIMLVVLGGLVGGLLIAMYLPIFKLAGNSG